MSEVATPVVSNINTNPTPTQTKETAPQAEQKPTQAEKQKFKLQIDGKDTELDEDTVVKWYRDEKKLKAGDQKLAEAAKLQKEIQKRIDEINKKEESLKPLSQLEGEDAFKYLLEKHQDSPEKLKKIRTAMENYLVEQIKMEDEAPEVRALREAERRAQALEKQLKEREEQDKKTTFEKVKEEQRGFYEKKILNIFGMTPIPPIEPNVRRAAEIIQKAKKAGFEPNDEVVAELLKSEIIENNKATSEKLWKDVLTAKEKQDADAIISLKQQAIELYGNDVFKALRIMDLADINKNRAQVPQPIVETPKIEKTEKPQRPMSVDEEREQRQRRVAELDKQWRATGKLG